MGTYEGPDGGDREHEEGFYTEVNDEGAEERTVHGQYTETSDFPGPDPAVEGEYTETEEDDEVVDASAEQGDYTERDQ